MAIWSDIDVQEQGWIYLDQVIETKTKWLAVPIQNGTPDNAWSAQSHMFTKENVRWWRLFVDMNRCRPQVPHIFCELVKCFLLQLTTHPARGSAQERYR